MIDIATIPEDELRSDLCDSYRDIQVCEFALLHDVTAYSGGDVQKRLDANKHFVQVIEAELLRRGKSTVVVLPPVETPLGEQIDGGGELP